MSKHGSLKHQVLQKINSLKRFGESKHKAKEREKARCVAAGEKWNPSRVPGIFSHSTADTYRERALEFARWEKQNHPEQKILANIPATHVAEFYNADAGVRVGPFDRRLPRFASYGLDARHSDQAAIEKYQQITRSQGEKAHAGIFPNNTS